MPNAVSMIFKSPALVENLTMIHFEIRAAKEVFALELKQKRIFSRLMNHRISF